MAATHVPVSLPHPPHILTPSSPATVNKHTPIAPTPGSAAPNASFITKEWNIPPRPKPGRKPAGDAPPTKRKAQNREAQRAFRERRAARVGELEEQLKEFQEESRTETDMLRSNIQQLENRIRDYINQISVFIRRETELENAYNSEIWRREEAEQEVKSLRRSHKKDYDMMPMQPLNDTPNQPSIQQSQPNPSINDVTCGRCDNLDNCKCVEEFFTPPGSSDGGQNPQPKRSHSPLAQVDTKRPRHSDDEESFEDNEIDFTAQFASNKPKNSSLSTINTAAERSTVAPDPCGFCSDGTECICAALATEISQNTPNFQTGSRARQTLTGSEDQISTSCTQNPGTCAQCQDNPTSKVFCKTFAAARRPSGSSSAITEDMQQSKKPVAATNTLSCADAFTQLAQHHAFPEANKDLGSWVSQLTAVPRTSKTEDKTAFEIEAASVMSVLKFFDKRFGQDTDNEAKSMVST